MIRYLFILGFRIVIARLFVDIALMMGRGLTALPLGDSSAFTFDMFF